MTCYKISGSRRMRGQYLFYLQKENPKKPHHNFILIGKLPGKLQQLLKYVHGCVPDFLSALRRSLSVWCNGMGVGITIINQEEKDMLCGTLTAGFLLRARQKDISRFFTQRPEHFYHSGFLTYHFARHPGTFKSLYNLGIKLSSFIS